jgi:hypothetical protein
MEEYEIILQTIFYGAIPFSQKLPGEITETMKNIR